MVDWPDWWEWELEFSSHLLKRMVDRGFNEADLRLMLEDATGCHPDHVEDRWIIETRYEGQPWEIVVEPDSAEDVLVVITAYSRS